MDDDDARRILSEGWATVTRLADLTPLDLPGDDDADDALAQWSAGMPRSEPQRPVKRNMATPTTQATDWADWIRAQLDEERKFLLTVIGQALGQALKRERNAARAELDDSIRSLKIELTEANTLIAELRRVIASERSSSAAIIDLAPVARRSN